MTLPFWLWQLLRSRKTRRAGIVLLCLLFVAVAGFYPVTNWWGRREFEKAEADARAHGFPVPKRVIEVEDLRDSFFCQPAFRAEQALPMRDRLGSHADLRGNTLRSVSILGMSGGVRIAAEQGQEDRNIFAPYQLRRAALIEAARQATPLAVAMKDACVEIPDGDVLLAIRLTRFFKEDAALAKVAGDRAGALESMEAYFRIFAELRQPRAIHHGKALLPSELADMIQTAILGNGCQGFDEAQLLKIDGMLAGADFETAWQDYFHEMPGECIWLRQKMLDGKLPGPRPSTKGLFAGWSWQPADIGQRAGVLWDAYKPFGLHEAEMAGDLRNLTAAAQNPHAGIGSLGRLTSPASPSSLNTHLHEYGRHFNVLLNWDLAEIQAAILFGRYLVAIERHRLRHGALPGRIEDLDGDLREGMPMDPLTGKPVDYARSDEGGFTLTLPTAEPGKGRPGWNFRAGK